MMVGHVIRTTQVDLDVDMDVKREPTALMTGGNTVAL